MSDKLLTVGDVAQVLRVPVSWVYDRVRKPAGGRLPHYKLGKFLRFRGEEVREFLERTIH